MESDKLKTLAKILADYVGCQNRSDSLVAQQVENDRRTADLYREILTYFDSGSCESVAFFDGSGRWCSAYIDSRQGLKVVAIKSAYDVAAEQSLAPDEFLDPVVCLGETS